MADVRSNTVNASSAGASVVPPPPLVEFPLTVLFPLTITTGGGGVASLTGPLALSGTWRERRPGRGGLVVGVDVGVDVGADVGPADLGTESGGAIGAGAVLD